MTSGPQTNAVVGVGPKLGALATSVVTTPTLALPARSARVDRDVDARSALAPTLELVGRAGRPACARRRAATTRAVVARGARARGGRRAQRREADPAGDDDDVAARGFCDRPRAERPAHAEHAAGLASRRSRRVTAPTARIVWTSSRRRAPGPADRDRHLADAEGVEHVELAGLEGESARRRRGSSVSVHVSAVSCRRSRDAERRAGRTHRPGWSSAAWPLP